MINIQNCYIHFNEVTKDKTFDNEDRDGHSYTEDENLYEKEEPDQDNLISVGEEVYTTWKEEVVSERTLLSFLDWIEENRDAVL